jgi:hypothetical protein
VLIQDTCVLKKTAPAECQISGGEQECEDGDKKPDNANCTRVRKTFEFLILVSSSSINANKTRNRFGAGDTMNVRKEKASIRMPVTVPKAISVVENAETEKAFWSLATNTSNAEIAVGKPEFALRSRNIR